MTALTFTLHPTTDELKYVGNHMRHGDRREVFASCGEDGLTALLRSAAMSEQMVLFNYHANPVCVSGISRLTDSIGVPWMLATPQVHDIPLKFWARASAAVVDLFHEKYPVLMNYVDERNEVSRGWLKHLGFTEKETTEFGHLGLPFIRFERIQNV